MSWKLCLQERDLFPFDKDVPDEGFDEAAEGTQEAESLDQAVEGEVDTDVAILFDVEIEKRGDKIRYVYGPHFIQRMTLLMFLEQASPDSASLRLSLTDRLLEQARPASGSLSLGKTHEAHLYQKGDISSYDGCISQ